ncbi:MAG: kelch motif-containing protein [Sandaracinaceae bacterium]|nr:kelch motif-containing protein [Sandaracinaceae bacterium]
MDLASPSPTFEPSGSSLPMPLFGAATVIEGERAHLFLGAHDFDAFNEQRFELALDDLTTTAAPLSGVPPTATGTAWSRAPFDPDFLVHATPLFQVLVDVRELAPDGDTLRPFGGTGIDLPLPTQDAVMAFRNDPGGSVLTVVGGREAFDRVWRMQESGAWAPFTITPDERGLSPTLRGAARYDGSHPQEGRVWQVLGDTTGGVADSLDVWRTEGDQWQQLTFLSTSPVPSGRGRVHHLPGLPDLRLGQARAARRHGRRHRVLRAERHGPAHLPRGRVRRHAGRLRVAIRRPQRAPGRAGARRRHRRRPPRRRAGSVGVPLRRRAVGAPPSNLLWALDPCTEDSAEEWVEVTLTDTRRPDARFGHTMTHVPAAGGDDTEPSTILIFGGAGGGDTYFSDVWRLVPVSADGAHEARFEPLTPAGDAPIGRMRHSAVYDPEQRRLIVFGGVRGFATLDDAWELRLRD